jgi:O-antigen/teichoic acid export membrane protein
VQSGVIWNAISVSTSYLSGLVRSIVMARLLMPEDFGLIGMALTVVTGLNALTAIGLELSVIKTKFKSDEELTTHLDTIWTVDLIRRIVLALLLAALAYPAAKFYREDRLYQILLLFSLLPFIQGLQNIGLLIYRKKIDFRKIVWLELATNFLTAATTIALVVWTRNVWALVLSQLLAAAIGVVLSYIFHPYRPRLAFDKAAFSLALHFGKYALLIGVLGYIMQMADNILLGRLFNAAVLGTYVIAYNLATLPIHGIANVIVNVTFPAYAEISSGEMKRLENAFVRVFTTSLLLLALTTALLLLLGDEIVVLLYGAIWAAAGTILRILSLLVFCRGCSVLISPLLVSIRGIAPDAKIKLAEAAIFLAVLYPLTSRFGAVGAAWAGAIAFFIAMLNRLYSASNLLPDISRTILRTLAGSVVATGAGIALGALAIFSLEQIAARLLIGGGMITIGVTGMMLALSPHLRAEFSRLLSALQARLPGTEG